LTLVETRAQEGWLSWGLGREKVTLSPGWTVVRVVLIWVSLTAGRGWMLSVTRPVKRVLE